MQYFTFKPFVSSILPTLQHTSGPQVIEIRYFVDLRVKKIRRYTQEKSKSPP